MKKMKYLSKMAFAIILSLTIVSCSEEETPLTTENTLLSIFEIQEIGRKHNEALTSVLTGLKESDISLSKNKNNISEILNFELDKYYQTSFKSENEIGSANFFSKKELLKYKLKSSVQRNNSTPIEIAIQENGEYLSQEQIVLLLELDDVLRRHSNLSASISEFNSIQSLAQSTLSASEAQLILISVEIAKASLQYWTDNIDEWQVTLGGDDISLQRGWFNWNKVVGGDIAGGVAGAAGALVVNLIPGVGQVSYVSAIVGAGVAGSVGSAVTQLLDYFF